MTDINIIKMETKQLNNYRIEFYSEEEFKDCIKSEEYDELKIERNINILSKITDYTGLVSGISEELAEKIVDCIASKLCVGAKQYSQYKDYKHDYDKSFITISSAKESFQTLSNLPYCVVITKII